MQKLHLVIRTPNIYPAHRRAWNIVCKNVDALGRIRSCKCCNQGVNTTISFGIWIYNWCAFSYKTGCISEDMKMQEQRISILDADIAKANFLSSIFELAPANFHPFADATMFESLLTKHRFIIRLSNTKTGSITITHSNPNALSSFKYLNQRFNVIEDGIGSEDDFYDLPAFLLACEEMF